MCIRDSLNDIKKMPLFKMGGVRGGLIIEQKIFREYPLDKIAERTIGYERKNNDKYVGVGLEHAFGEILRGKEGSQLMQKISNGKWKPIESLGEIEPKAGLDIVTTINIGFQDIAHHSLLSQLENFEADHGSVVIMETNTGAIKAISNLGVTSQNKYFEKLDLEEVESIVRSYFAEAKASVNLLRFNKTRPILAYASAYPLSISAALRN